MIVLHDTVGADAHIGPPITPHVNGAFHHFTVGRKSFSLGTAPTGAFRSATERSEALGAEMKLAKIFDF